MFFLLLPIDTKKTDSDSFLRELGYQITGKSAQERLDILVNKAVPEFGIGTVVEAIVSFMLSRTGNDDRVGKFSYALQQWNNDVNCLMDRYAKDDLVLQLRLQRLKEQLRRNGYEWLDNK
ncbi:MAG: hypothetical protein PHV55_08140 [Candidatus Omnitrophica bacterium]|nr:hypothetical protein [Candidatus Omnitrophota bacterium]